MLNRRATRLSTSLGMLDIGGRAEMGESPDHAWRVRQADIGPANCAHRFPAWSSL